MTRTPKDWQARMDRADKPFSDPSMHTADVHLQFCLGAGLSRDEAIRRACAWLGAEANTAPPLRWAEAFYRVLMDALSRQDFADHLPERSTDDAPDRN